MANKKVAFIGLGVMGFPMAGHLAAKGHDVTVYNRTASRAGDWTKAHEGTSAGTPAAAADLKVVHFNIMELDTVKLQNPNRQLKAVQVVLGQLPFDVLSVQEMQYDFPGVPFP
ncbi:MAG: NAD(P)-dependent oxidoreductase, partial [Proteobacteria bacterium]|nr:NAD(P)-dependent oxidoreductase [Pseudomonadota bacterium]